MLAFVYKSLKKADTYLYLATRDDFGCLPEPLRAQLGNLQFVLEVGLTPERRLAREGRTALAQACFDFLPTRAHLDLMGWGDDNDIFHH